MLKKYIKLLAYIGPYKKKRIFIIFICSLSIFVSTVIPYLIGNLINYITQGESINSIIEYGFFTAIITIASSGLDSFQNYKWHIYMNEFINYFRNLMLKAALDKDISFYKNKSEDFSTRILHDSIFIAEDISVGFPMLVLNIFRLTFVVILMFKMNIKLTLIPFLIVPIYILIFHIINKDLRIKSKEEREKFSLMSKSVNETLNGIFDIKINLKEKFFINRFGENIKNYLVTLRKIKGYKAFSYGVSTSISNILPIAVLVVGGIMVSQGQLKLGFLFSFYAYLDFLYEPMNNLVDWYTNLNISLGMADRVLEFLNETENTENLLNEIDSIDSIEINNLSFSYNDGINILENINLNLEKGDILGVVGPSGSGKSTFIEILLKIWDSYRGSIKINGIELKDLDRHSFYKKVAVLQQEPFIFTDTIYNNITFSDDNGNYFEVEKDSKIKKIVEEKGGKDYLLVSAGEELSGGEKQRLAIGRVLYKKADLVILDEFTSSLDMDTEKEIVDGIAKLNKKDKIYIIISHRKYPLSITNKILDLGKVVEKI